MRRRLCCPRRAIPTGGKPSCTETARRTTGCPPHSTRSVRNPLAMLPSTAMKPASAPPAPSKGLPLRTIKSFVVSHPKFHFSLPNIHSEFGSLLFLYFYSSSGSKLSMSRMRSSQALTTRRVALMPMPLLPSGKSFCTNSF